jgi:hypothetical protein
MSTEKVWQGNSRRITHDFYDYSIVVDWYISSGAAGSTVIEEVAMRGGAIGTKADFEE